MPVHQEGDRCSALVQQGRAAGVVIIMLAMTHDASAEENLKKRNITLPTPPTPVANYVTSVRVGNLLFLSGHGPTPGTPAGKVGKELTLEQGAAAARAVGL